MKSLGFSVEFLALRRASYVEEDATFQLSNVRCGVLFLMAFWSGHARKAFAELKRVLTEVDPAGRLELVVIDVDGCTQLAELPEIGIQMAGGGYGETVWVRGGAIVSSTGRGFHPECFMENTRRLLAECNQDAAQTSASR